MFSTSRTLLLAVNTIHTESQEGGYRCSSAHFLGLSRQISVNNALDVIDVARVKTLASNKNASTNDLGFTPELQFSVCTPAGIDITI